MRAVVFAVLFAFAMFTPTGVVVDADAQGCIINSSGVTTCVNSYIAAATSVSTICPALSNYIDCLGQLFACNPLYAETWRSSLAAYRTVWSSSCTLIPPVTGSTEWGMVFGDPHYQLNNGTFQTCNDVGNFTLAVSDLFLLTVTHGTVGNNATTAGTVITAVTAEMFHAGAPAGTFTWTPTSSPTAVSQSGVSVTADGIDGISIGLKLRVTRRSDHLMIGVVTKNLKGGILKDGCAAPVTVPSTSNITGECADVPAALQSQCLFDSDRMGTTWAASASVAAKSEQTTLETAATTENGVAAVAAFMSAIAVMVASGLLMLV